MCQMNTGTGDSECVSVCTLSGLTPCTCDDPYECVVCCRDGSGQCSPTEVESTVDGNRTNTTLPLSNGAGCSNNMRVCIDVSGSQSYECKELILSYSCSY